MSLFWRAHGDRAHPVLLFFHGFMGCSEDWAEVIAALKDQYWCVCFDLPGHGNSVQLASYEVDAVEGAVRAWLAEEKVSRFSMVGYSMGARVAMQLTNSFAGKLDALIVESGHYGIEDAAARAARWEQDCALAERLGSEPYPAFLERWYAQPLFESLARKTRLKEKAIQTKLANDPKELAAALRGLSVGNQPFQEHLLRRPAFPILALSGELDTKYASLFAGFEGVENVVVPETGHNVHLENPAAYIKAVTNFLNNTLER